jgi:GPH family glycoside/pentoside/hexuronide:cation symporter
MNTITKWKEPAYAFSAFGPNLLNIFVMAYLLDAVIPAGLIVDRGLWSFTGAAIAAPLLFATLFTIVKILDGVIDIPLAALFQRLAGRKIGRHRTGMLIGFIPACLFYLLMWNPVIRTENSGLNAVLIPIFALLYFASYTLMQLSYYSSFTEIVPDERSRVRLSSWKAIWDVVGYSIAYALLPLFIGLGMNIHTIVMYFSPLLLTMLIPQFIVKEHALSTPAAADGTVKAPGLVASLKLSLSNRDFMKYLCVMGMMMFGLQIFLAGQNVIASGGMELNGWQIAIMNSAAFGPVPLMAVIFNFIQKKHGIWYSYRLGLITFAIAMLIFASAFFLVGNPWYVIVIVGAIGGTVGSFSLAVFFSTQYVLPSQIAADEMTVTGRNNGSMYFAVQGLVVQVVTALSAFVYLNLKQISFLGREEYGIALVAPLVAAACVIAVILSVVIKGTKDAGTA